MPDAPRRGIARYAVPFALLAPLVACSSPTSTDEDGAMCVAVLEFQERLYWGQTEPLRTPLTGEPLGPGHVPLGCDDTGSGEKMRHDTVQVTALAGIPATVAVLVDGEVYSAEGATSPPALDALFTPWTCTGAGPLTLIGEWTGSNAWIRASEGAAEGVGGATPVDLILRVEQSSPGAEQYNGDEVTIRVAADTHPVLPVSSYIGDTLSVQVDCDGEEFVSDAVTVLGSSPDDR